MSRLGERPVPEKVMTKKILESWGRIIFFDWFKNRKSGKLDDYMLFTIADGMVPGMILPITKTGKVIVVRQFRQAAQQLVIEIPGGCTKPGEMQSPAMVATRELKEETGYMAKRVIDLKPAMLDPFFIRIRHSLFLGLDCEKVCRPKIEDDEDPDMEVVEFDLHDWIKACLDGEIEDSKSVVATLRAIPYLKEFGVELKF